MRQAPWIAALLVGGCHAEPRADVAPDSRCTTVAHHMIDMMLPKDPAPPAVVKTIVDLIVERCQHDGWSVEADRCLLAMKSLDDHARCEELLTVGQRDALAKELDEKLPRPAKQLRREDRDDSGDPCEGGE